MFGFDDVVLPVSARLKFVCAIKWPEVVDYMSYIRDLPEVASDAYGTARLARQVYSGRIRGNCTYTAAANTHFQGLGSDATKHAGFLLSKACYTEPSSPLFGSRIVAYIHDEFLLEVPEGGASEAAEELARLMIIGANKFIPQVPVRTDPLLMRVWSKDAVQCRDESGKIIPWEPS